MSSKSICLVGGGISCLVAGQVLVSAAKARSLPLRVVLLESGNRLGGQIRTQSFALPNISGKPIIIESGAEGFVARSKVFPEISELSGLTADVLVNQQRTADCELKFNDVSKRYEIQELEPGVAAEKLGFQVPKEDRGRGIRSFVGGMSQIVNQIGSNIADVRLNARVNQLVKCAAGYEVHYGEDRGSSLRADAVIIGTPLRVIRSVLSRTPLSLEVENLNHNSHVSVHLLISSNQIKSPIRSFTVPDVIQKKFSGLRAVSLVNEKFPGRSPHGTYLFRFYFRPPVMETLNDEKYWIETSRKVLAEVFGFTGSCLWAHHSPWEAALPILNSNYLECMSKVKRTCTLDSGGMIEIIGSEISGAGLEAAANSGYEAAYNILDSLFR